MSVAFREWVASKACKARNHDLCQKKRVHSVTHRFIEIFPICIASCRYLHAALVCNLKFWFCRISFAHPLPTKYVRIANGMPPSPAVSASNVTQGRAVSTVPSSPSPRELMAASLTTSSAQKTTADASKVTLVAPLILPLVPHSPSPLRVGPQPSPRPDLYGVYLGEIHHHHQSPSGQISSTASPALLPQWWDDKIVQMLRGVFYYLPLILLLLPL